MDELEDSDFRRPAGRERTVGGTRKSPINKALFETGAVNLANLADHERDA